jgi:hypothetical protein
LKCKRLCLKRQEGKKQGNDWQDFSEQCLVLSGKEVVSP